MKVNGKEININDAIKDIFDDKNMIKMRGNGIYLSDNEVSILERYGINYNKYPNLNSLIFDIEKILNVETDGEDLEEISKKLSEFNYYNNTNK